MTNITIDKIVNDTLRGQPFIAEKDENGYLRICESCYFGAKEANNPGGIDYAGKCLTSEPRRLFEVDPLPSILDGKKVGNYCSSYMDLLDLEEI